MNTADLDTNNSQIEIKSSSEEFISDTCEEKHDNIKPDKILPICKEIIKSRQAMWNDKGLEFLMKPFVGLNYEDKVNDWIGKHFKNNMKMLCNMNSKISLNQSKNKNEDSFNQLKKSRISHNKSDSEESYQSFDTAKYILSNKSKKQKTNMTIKQYCIQINQITPQSDYQFNTSNKISISSNMSPNLKQNSSHNNKKSLKNSKHHKKWKRRQQRMLNLNKSKSSSSSSSCSTKEEFNLNNRKRKVNFKNKTIKNDFKENNFKDILNKKLVVKVENSINLISDTKNHNQSKESDLIVISDNSSYSDDLLELLSSIKK